MSFARPGRAVRRRDGIGTLHCGQAQTRTSHHHGLARVQPPCARVRGDKGAAESSKRNSTRDRSETPRAGARGLTAGCSTTSDALLVGRHARFGQAFAVWRAQPPSASLPRSVVTASRRLVIGPVGRRAHVGGGTPPGAPGSGLRRGGHSKSPFGHRDQFGSCVAPAAPAAWGPRRGSPRDVAQATCDPDRVVVPTGLVLKGMLVPASSPWRG